MILSASRRTDIPAFYSEWFVNRLREGYVLVPNPYNTRHLSYIPLSPAHVDCIVFWTKDAAPIFDKLGIVEELGYKDYYFEFTVTPYDESIEKHLPPKGDIIQTFQRLSDRLGPDRVDWRFDPILLNEQTGHSCLLTAFEKMCKQLAGYTTKCIISFIDIYKHISPAFTEISPEQQMRIAKDMAEIAATYHLQLYACCEKHDFSLYGIHRSACIDREKIERIIGCALLVRKDANQRTYCSCMESIDIGVYNTCQHACTYCYAVRQPNTARQKWALHDPHSPMLIGVPTGEEIITSKVFKSLKDNGSQLCLF